jgi:5'-nucleotidase
MRTRLLIVTAAALGGAWFAACQSDSALPAPASDAGTSATADAPASDAVADGQAPMGTADVVVLAMSDWRGQLEPVVEFDTNGVPQSYGGLDGLSTYFAAERATAAQARAATLLVTTGGAFGATPPLASASGDTPVALGLNLLGATADTFGAHDFDRGSTVLKALLDQAAFKVVSTNLANVAVELGPKPATPMYLFDLDQGRGKVTFAVLGITDTSLSELASSANLGTISVRTPLSDEANRAAKNARLLGASVVIAVAAIGASDVDGDGQPSGPLAELAASLTGIDLLVGGVTDRVVNVTTPAGVHVVETRLRGRSFARVTLHVERGVTTVLDATMVDPLVVERRSPSCDAGADAGPCACGPSSPCPSGFSCSDASACENPHVIPSPEAGAILDAAGVALKALSDTPVAKMEPADSGLASFKMSGTDSMETDLGNLVADAVLAKYKDSGVQIALVEGSRILGDLPTPYKVDPIGSLHRPPDTGEIDLVYGDVYALLPVMDGIVVRTITGQTLHLALERSVSKLPDPGFLQVAGIKLTYSTGSDAGSRLRTLVLDDGTPIPNDTTTYRVAMTDRISAGKDGYTMLAESLPTPSRDLLVDAFAKYLKGRERVTPPAFGRITAKP